MLAPLASTDPRSLSLKVQALEGRIDELRSQYDAAKGFLLEAERRSADLRKAVRSIVLELRRGVQGRTELADALEAAILPRDGYVPNDGEEIVLPDGHPMQHAEELGGGK
jgi:hypothetical protein